MAYVTGEEGGKSQRDLILILFALSRCSDRAPAVRTKALTQLAALLEAARMDCSRTLPVLHATTASAWQQVCLSTAVNSFSLCSKRPSSFVSQSTPSTKQLSEELSLMLMRRLADTKGTVRKAAVQAMEACLLSGDLQSAPAKVGGVEGGCCVHKFQIRPHTSYFPSLKQLDVLAGRCSDAGLNVRKQALMSLHNILGNAPTVPAVLRWVR